MVSLSKLHETLRDAFHRSLAPRKMCVDIGGHRRSWVVAGVVITLHVDGSEVELSSNGRKTYI